MLKGRTKPENGGDANAAGKQPEFKENPQVNAKIDDYIKNNPKYWDYVQSMTPERMARALVLTEIQKGRPHAKNGEIYSAETRRKPGDEAEHSEHGQEHARRAAGESDDFHCPPDNESNRAEANSGCGCEGLIFDGPRRATAQRLSPFPRRLRCRGLAPKAKDFVPRLPRKRMMSPLHVVARPHRGAKQMAFTSMIRPSTWQRSMRIPRLSQSVVGPDKNRVEVAIERDRLPSQMVTTEFDFDFTQQDSRGPQIGDESAITKFPFQHILGGEMSWIYRPQTSH